MFAKRWQHYAGLTARSGDFCGTRLLDLCFFFFFSTTCCLGICLHTPRCICRCAAFLLLGNPAGYLPFHSSLSKANKRRGKSKIQQQILAYADKSIPDSVVTLTRSSLKFLLPLPLPLIAPAPHLFAAPLLFLTEVSLFQDFNVIEWLWRYLIPHKVTLL